MKTAPPDLAANWSAVALSTLLFLMAYPQITNIGKLDALLFHPRAARLFWLAWGILALGLLNGIARNGHYMPVSTKPNLCLDTRTGKLHIAQTPDSFAAEVEVLLADDKRTTELRRVFTQ